MSRYQVTLQHTEIGIILSHWEIVPFGDVCTDSAFGPRFGGDLYASDGNVATLRTTDLDDWGRISYSTMPLARLDIEKFKKHFLQLGDLIITRSGTCGRTAIFEGFHIPVLPGAFSIRFRLSSKADNRFFCYYFNSRVGRPRVLDLTTGSVQPNLTSTALLELKVPLPPLNEQKAISQTLGTLDRKIENLRRQNETLEAIAQTLFKHWFVDFEFPNEDGKPYKSSGGEMVRSDLGEIPVVWRVLTLKEICETIYRYPQFYGMDKSDKGVPVIRGEHLLPNGKISNDFSDYWFVSDEFSEKFPRTILKKFDVVLSVRGSVGNYSWVGNQHIGVQISPNTIRLSANPNILHDCLLYPFLKGCNFKNRLLQTVSSSAVPAINASEFKTFDFIIPSLSVQEQISPLFRDIYQKIDANEHQMQTLTKTRDVLLPKLMSGKLRITE